MQDKHKLFQSSLSVPLFEQYNVAIFNLLHSPEYENYTDVVLSTLGTELEKYFKPDEMRLKYRYKSRKSFNANNSKDSKVAEKDYTSNLSKDSESIKNDFESDFNVHINYDIIGMRLVVENVNDNFEIDKSFIENCKKNLLATQRELFELEKQYSDHYNKNYGDTSLSIKTLLSKDPVLKQFAQDINVLKHKINYLGQCIEFKKLLSYRNKAKKLLLKMNDAKNSQSEIQETEKIFNDFNNIVCMIAGDYAIDHIFSTSEKLKKLGLFLNDDRKKFFHDSTGYTAIHFSIESTLLPAWKAELQDRSSEVEYLSKYGPITHNSLSGKKRYLEDLPTKAPNRKINDYLKKHSLKYFDNTSKLKSTRAFMQKLSEYVVPYYTKYIGDGYIKRYTIAENIHHYHKKLLLENREYSKQLDDILKNDENEAFIPEINRFQKNELEK